MYKGTSYATVEASTPGAARRWLLPALGAILVAATAISAYLSPAFRVQDIQVIAPENMDAAYLASLADIKGESMFNVSLSEARDRLEALPWIKSVQLQREWPQGVRIEVTPRAPWGYWQAGPNIYLIDEEGVVLVADGNIGAAPFIRHVDSEKTLIAGDKVDPDAVMVVQRLWAELPERFGLEAVDFTYSRSDGLSVTTDAGYTVILGDSHNLEYKLAIWRAVEDEVGRESMQGQALDVRFGDRPSLRHQQGEVN